MTVQWKGIPPNESTYALPMTFVNANQVTAEVDAILIAAEGTANVTVTNDGVTSAPVAFNILAAPSAANHPEAVSPSRSVETPDVRSIVNSASFGHSTVSPGELLTIFGRNVGPPQPLGLTVRPDRTISTTIGGLTVFFDDVAAPLVYADANQVNVIAPYSIAGRPRTSIHLEWNGQRSDYVSIPVSQTSPGIFTINSSGSGPGAILNQDGTVNSLTNPAARGSIVSVYGTGYGATWPDSIDGSIVDLPLEHSALPIAAYIGGQIALISYAGRAPALVAGVLQVNVKVPIDAPTGNAVPILLTMDSVSSQHGVTLSVK
jgi:uncharacterized protein (TIGR03437 family)